MPTQELIQKAAEKLFSQVGLSGDEENRRFNEATDVAYWENLLPGSGVLQQQGLADLEGVSFSEEQQLEASASLAKRGYFQTRPLLADEVTTRMCACVDMLRSAGWPAVFTYIYDDFWAVWRTPSVARFLRANLGEGYVQTSGVWTYRVDPQKQGSGWGPHVDSRDDAERLSIWIPLTEATARNGCMFVIPLDRVPLGLPTSFLDWTSIPVEKLSTLLHGVTPLPALPGSILGWNNRLIHWGGRASEPADGVRVSIAAEFLPVVTRPGKSELPLVGVEVPDFSTRIRIIAQAILAYEKFEPLMRRYRGLATRLAGWAS